MFIDTDQSQMWDQSTARQWAEGVSPLCAVKDQHTRESAVVEVVEQRARSLGAGKAATAWGCLGARNAIKAGESGHRAISIGIERVTDVMEIGNGSR